MKHFAFLLTILFATVLFGCHKSEKPPVVIQPQPMQPEVAPVEPVQPSIPRSSSWMRGYNDGYGGAWLGPGSWVFSNDYRAGWAAGNKDLKEGRPHRFNP